MTSFLLALQFLTTIPLWMKSATDKQLANSLIFFPVVGLFLGLILIGMNGLLLALKFDYFIINIILVIFLLIITGSLHLDGLADTFDAVSSNKNKEEMLKIMRDPHIATMGVISIVSVILLKISLLYSIAPSLKNAALIIMCTAGRWSMVLDMLIFPYARDEGKAKIYTKNINARIFIFSTIIAVCVIGGVLRLKGLFVFAAIGGLAYLGGKFAERKLGGITGDTLGATNELIEIAALFIIYIMGKVNLWRI